MHLDREWTADSRWLTMTSEQQLKPVIRAALDGEAVLFVGSGFSRSATNVRGEKLKTAKELAERLAIELGLTERPELSTVAEMYADERSNSALVAILNEEFQVQEIANEHRVFGRVPWRRVYTTNYDDVIELSYRANSRVITSLTPEDKVSYVASEQSQCVHINGYIGALRKDNLFAGFQLTDTSYATTVFSASQWAQQMRHDFSVARAVVFVGYSLYDLDVRRVLLVDGTLQPKTFFCVGPEPLRSLSHRLSKFGTVVEVDTVTLSGMIGNEERDYVPKKPEVTLGRVVVKRQQASSKGAPQDRDIGSLFLWGVADYDFIWGAVAKTGNSRYVCYREALDQALQLLEDGTRNIIVRSELGNGKSIFLDSLDCLANILGFEVLRIDALEDEFEGEVEAAARASTKTLLIVDSYNNKKEALDIVSRNRSDNLYLVCAARTVRHDVSFRWLHETLGTTEIPEIDLEVLTEGERRWFREALDEYGLWGRYAARSPIAKDNILRVKCKSRISSVLLLILESPTIAERLNAVVQELKTRRQHLEAITGLVILSVLDFHPSLAMATELMGMDVLNRTEFRQNEAVRQFLDFRHEHVRMRSSVVGGYLLKNVIHKSISLKALKQLVRRTEELRHKVVFRSLFRELMRTASVDRVLPDSAGMVASYYEFVLSRLRGARYNTNFWLQYAIANIAMKRYEQAKLKLDTAYSLAGDDYNTFMLDTTHARWLLEEACEKPRSNREPAMAVFRKARNFLHPLLASREERYNPFRVATKYSSFFAQHRAVLSEGDRDEIRNAAVFVLTRIEALPAERREQRYIRECGKELERLIATCVT